MTAPPELAVLIGLQASGKSTFVRSRLAGTHAVVSKDHWPNARRRQRRQMTLVDQHLAAGRSVAVDNTNPAPDDRVPLVALGRHHGATVTGYWFDATVDACAARNARRTGRARVPDVGLFATVARLRPPTWAEGFDRLWVVRLAGDGDFTVQPWTGAGGMAADGR